MIDGPMSGLARLLSARCRLEWELHARQQVLDMRSQPADRMGVRRLTQVFRSHMQIDLRARDQSMPEEVADRHDPDARLHEVCRERVPQSVRRDDLADVRASPPGTGRRSGPGSC